MVFSLVHVMYGVLCALLALCALFLVLGVVLPPPDSLHDPSRSHVSWRAGLVVYSERVVIVIQHNVKTS